MDKRQLQLTVEYLRLLDLDAGAGIADVRDAYRLLVRMWDPDHPAYDSRVRAASERKLADVRQAYEWLRDNADLVLAQTRSAGIQPAKKSNAPIPRSSFLTPLMRALKLDGLPPKLVAHGFLYLILVGLLLFGIVFVAASDSKAWLGPLVTPTTQTTPAALPQA